MKLLYNTLLTILLALFAQTHLTAQLEWQRIEGPPNGYGQIVLGASGQWVTANTSIGVYASGDGGHHWQFNELPNPIHTEAALHIGTDGQLWFFDFATLEQSADNGQTWTSVLTSGSKWIANDCFATLIFDGGALFLGANATGIVRSTDSSKTISTVFPVTGGLNSISRNPANGHLFAWKTVPTAGQINKIYRSIDQGITQHRTFDH